MEFILSIWYRLVYLFSCSFFSFFFLHCIIPRAVEQSLTDKSITYTWYYSPLSFELGYIEPTDDESSSKCMSAKLSLLRVPRYISLVNWWIDRRLPQNKENKRVVWGPLCVLTREQELGLHTHSMRVQVIEPISADWTHPFVVECHREGVRWRSNAERPITQAV